MGNYASKLFSNHSEHEAKSKIQSHVSTCGLEKLKLCTPPISKRKLATDPRSATLGISRTPIEIASTPPGLTRRVASALPKYLQGKRYLETDFDAATPVTTPDKCIPDPRSPNVTEKRTPIIVKSVSSYLTPNVIVNAGPDMDTPVARKLTVSALDPRSPAIDFDRTPILKPRSIERISTATDDIDNGIAESNVCNTRLSFCETTTDYSIPEIQAVSEMAPVLDESLSLQNRIDLCQGSSGNSISSRSSSVEEISEGSETEEQVTVIRNPKVLSPWSDALSTWTEYKPVEADGGISDKDTELDDPMVKKMDGNISDIINAVMKNSIAEMKTVAANDKIKVWRDSVSPDIPEEAENGGHKGSEEIIIEFDDEILTKMPKTISAAKLPVKIEDDKTKSQTKKKKPQQQQLLKGEKKPVSDERKVFNNDGRNTVDAAKNRTPLGNRSNNHKQLSTAKSPQQILRNKGLSARTIHQENTPPHTDRFISKTKPNGIQWDADTTVVI